MSNKRDSIGDRMKDLYEKRAEAYLTRRTPVIIRIDGAHFHTFTKGFRRPYDKVFHAAMNKATEYLCHNIQGCKIGYTQSDEISLLLTDYDTLETDAWFDNRVQKMCSTAAAMATMAFNKHFMRIAENWLDEFEEEWNPAKEDYAIAEAYRKATAEGATFDARVFTIPDEEAVNYFIWRQQDATRNAIQMLGQAHFTHKELNGKSCNDIQDMLFTQKQINFNNMPAEFKRGVCVKRNENNTWQIDYNIPVFTQDREYIESVLPERK